MRRNEFPDRFDSDFEFKQSRPCNPIMRQNSILTPTDTPCEYPLKSTSPSTGGISGNDNREEECFSTKRFCHSLATDSQKGRTVKSELDHTSSNGEECSMATKSASFKKQPQDSISEEVEEDDMIYVPFDYQGDGRKREAKRHKSHAVVPRDEIDLDAQIRER